MPLRPRLTAIAVTGYGALRGSEMYHLAPIAARGTIAVRGLDFHSTQPRSRARQYADSGNYMWDNYAATLRYREFWAGRDFDLYKVNVSGLALRADPLGIEGAFLTIEQILPARLTRVVLNPPTLDDSSDLRGPA
jgi:hypothetical protein